MPTIEDAIILAAEAHRGQTDKAGMSYITHPLRVMAGFLTPEDEDARIAAVLHDLVEDTSVTIPGLLHFGYSSEVVAAVDALTRREGEPYEQYIERVGLNPLALRVKLGDLVDNLNPGRLSTAALSPETRRKYRDAQEYLRRLGESRRMASES